jgi:hypothetical protein
MEDGPRNHAESPRRCLAPGMAGMDMASAGATIGRVGRRRRDVLRASAVAIAALSLYAAVSRTAAPIRADRAAVQARSASTPRDLVPAARFSLVPLIEAARRVIPEDAVYTVVVGESPRVDALTAEAVQPMLSYGLAPRRYTPQLADADWVITYHQSSEALGVKVGREVGLDADGNAVRVAR